MYILYRCIYVGDNVCSQSSKEIVALCIYVLYNYLTGMWLLKLNGDSLYGDSYI